MGPTWGPFYPFCVRVVSYVVVLRFSNYAYGIKVDKEGLNMPYFVFKILLVLWCKLSCVLAGVPDFSNFFGSLFQLTPRGALVAHRIGSTCVSLISPMCEL